MSSFHRSQRHATSVVQSIPLERVLGRYLPVNGRWRRFHRLANLANAANLANLMPPGSSLHDDTEKPSTDSRPYPISSRRARDPCRLAIKSVPSAMRRIRRRSSYGCMDLM